MEQSHKDLTVAKNELVTTKSELQTMAATREEFQAAAATRISFRRQSRP